MAYLGDSINFTCVTRGSTSLVWKSNDYIGPDGERIEFNRLSIVLLVRQNPYTELELISIETENGQTVITSQLRIIVQRTSRYSSVTCLTSGTEQQTITFHFTGMCSLHS